MRLAGHVSPGSSVPCSPPPVVSGWVRYPHVLTRPRAGGDDPAVPCSEVLASVRVWAHLGPSGRDRSIDSPGAGPQLRAPTHRHRARRVLDGVRRPHPADLPAGRPVRSRRRPDHARTDRHRPEQRRLATRRARRSRLLDDRLARDRRPALPRPIDRRVVDQLTAFGSQTLLPSIEAVYPWLRRPRRDKPVRRDRRCPPDPGRVGASAAAASSTGVAIAAVATGLSGGAFGAVAIANDVALRDKTVAALAVRTDERCRPAAAVRRAARRSASTARLRLELAGTADLRPIGSVDLSGAPRRQRLPLAGVRRHHPPARANTGRRGSATGRGCARRRSAGGSVDADAVAADTLDVQALSTALDARLPGDRRGSRRGGPRRRARAALPGRRRRRDVRGGLPAGPLARRFGRPATAGAASSTTGSSSMARSARSPGSVNGEAAGDRRPTRCRQPSRSGSPPRSAAAASSSILRPDDVRRRARAVRDQARPARSDDQARLDPPGPPGRHPHGGRRRARRACRSGRSTATCARSTRRSASRSGPRAAAGGSTRRRRSCRRSS